MIGDRRGVTTPVSYTLTLTIALVLVSGLLIGGTTLVNDTRARTMDSQLSTLAQQVAGSVEAADRILNSTEGTNKRLVMTRDLPARVLGSGYTIQVTERDGNVGVELEANDQNVEVWAEMDLTHAVDRVKFTAREIEIRWNAGTEEIVVDNV